MGTGIRTVDSSGPRPTVQNRWANSGADDRVARPRAPVTAPRKEGKCSRRKLDVQGSYGSPVCRAGVQGWRAGPVSLGGIRTELIAKTVRGKLSAQNQVWQRGQKYVSRCVTGVSPSDPRRIFVPQRRHGLFSRRLTHAILPGRRSPVVVRSTRSRLARMTR